MKARWTLISLVLLLLVVRRSVQQEEVCPRLCKCNDVYVNCSAMGLRSFPDGINPEIQVLDLSKNIINEFPPSLKQFSNLRALDLSHNRIFSLDKTTFQGLVNLEELDLSFNKFPNIIALRPNESFAHLPKLKRLVLVNNTLLNFGDQESSCFASSSLEELDVRACSIRKFSGNSSFSKLGNLRLLNASHNPLAWVMHLTSTTLTKLDISHANLDSIGSNAVEEQKSLHTLLMGYNDKLRYHKAFQSTSLVVLDARYCNILFPELTGMPNLERVIYHRNVIESLEKQHFINSTRLRHLDLSLNKISSLENDVFVHLVSLEYLNMAHNEIKAIAWNSFVANYNLKVLDLSRNSIPALVNFSSNSLLELDFSNCELKSVDKDALGGLPILLKLNISGNIHVKHLPVRFYSHSLTSLDVSSCRLVTVSNVTFIEMPRLKELFLHGNGLVTVPKSSLLTQLKLTYISLYDNSWRCDCDDEDFKFFWTNLTDSKPTLMTLRDSSNLICVSPENVASKSWLSACKEFWYPLPPNGTMFNRYGTAILICLICVGGCFLLVTVLRHSLHRRKKKRHERRVRRASEAQAMQERLRAQHLEALLQQEHERITTRSPVNGRHVRSPSQITQPPTYEEAVEMARSMERLEVPTSEPQARGSSTPQASVENSRKKTEQQSKRDSHSSSESTQEEAEEQRSDRSVPLESQDYEEESTDSYSEHIENGST